MPGVEETFAEAAKEYARRHSSEIAGRERLELVLQRVYSSFGRSVPATVRETLRNPSAPLFQVAHDGQLPHLGVVRLVLKTREIAIRAGGIAVYLVGDHYTAMMRPKNVFIGMPLRGKNPDQVKQPLRLPIRGEDRDVPFMFVDPPSREDVISIFTRMRHWTNMNIANERMQGNRVRSESEILARLVDWQARLTAEAAAASSMGDWLTRAQLRLLDELVGDAPSPLLVLPMSEFRTAIREELQHVLDVSKNAQDSGLWMYCPRCHHRTRPERTEELIRLMCSHCTTFSEEPIDPTGPNQFPDIVAFEAAALTLFSGWIVGSRAEYLPTIDHLFQQCWGRPPPPREYLTGVPIFRGIGEPKEGYGRSRLLRVLLEVDGPVLRKQLLGPWEENPRITSLHLVQSAAE